MTVARAFRALEFYDVLANLVPGAVLLLALSIIFQTENYIQLSTGAMAAGVFLVSALVFGHLVQVVASELDGTPTLFADVVSAARSEEVENPAIKVTHVEKAVWPLMKRKFALPDDFANYGEMFRLLLSYIETTPATRALRFQALHSFHRSMWAVGHITAALALLGSSLKYTDSIAVRSWTILGLSFGGSIVGILVFRQRKEKMNKRFIQYAIADFYVDQMDEINSREWRRGS